MYGTHTMHLMVEQAAALHGVRAIPLTDYSYEIPGRGFIEHHPDRLCRRWDAERLDDENNSVIRSYDHAIEAVRSFGS